MGVLLTISMILVIWAIMAGLPGGYTIAAILSLCSINGYKVYRKLKKTDKITSEKTIHNYMKINGISDANDIYCAHCKSTKISNRTHMSKVFREFYCSMCGETLYYVERKDYI